MRDAAVALSVSEEALRAADDLIAARRREIIERVASITGRKPECEKDPYLTYTAALATHVVTTARHAVRSNERVFNSELAWPPQEVSPTVVDKDGDLRLIVVPVSECRAFVGGPASPDSHALSADSLRAALSAGCVTAFGDALENMTRSGFGWLAQRASAVVTLDADEVAQSRSGRPGAGTSPSQIATANLKAYCEGVLLGETLLHEAAHALLSETANSEGVRLPDEPSGFSPWRNSGRPAWGLIHGAFAFSVVVLYHAALLQGLDGPPADTSTSRIAEESARLASSSNAVSAARDAMQPSATRDLFDLVRHVAHDSVVRPGGFA